jgi:hypothetical protein
MKKHNAIVFLFIFSSLQSMAASHELLGYSFKKIFKEVPESQWEDQEHKSHQVVFPLGKAQVYRDHARVHLNKLIHINDFQNEEFQVLKPLLAMHGVPTLYAVSIASKGITFEMDTHGAIKRVRFSKPWSSRGRLSAQDVLKRVGLKVAKK